jgi:hypothetical protein
MIRAMDLPMAIGTTAIDGPYIQRFPGGGRVARQHMNMALLAHQMNTGRQKLGIARTMRRVTVHAILADRRVFPEKRTAFFGMAGVTHIIGGKVHEHIAPLPAMRIVAGSAADLHVAKLGAKQVGGALEKILSPLNVATETSFFDSETGQHFIGQLGVDDLRRLALRCISEVGPRSTKQLDMMYVVARQAAHVASVMLPALPVEMCAIHRMTLQARLIRCGRSHFARIAYIPFAGCLGTRFGVLVAVRVTDLTLSAA